MCNLGSLHNSSVHRNHTNMGMANTSTSIGSRDHSTIRVSHHGSRNSHGARINHLGRSRDHTKHRIDMASSMMEGSLGRFDFSSSLVEVSPSSSNRWGVLGDHSTIRVSHHWSRNSHGSRIDLF